MDDIKISVIVPVYNVIEYIDKCVNSLINQTLREIEILLIDDGSSDGSYEKCLEYVKIDSRISAHQQQHKKASAARNNGMSRARGKYIMFVDSDDYIEHDALETLYSEASKDDLDVIRASLLIDEGDIRKDSRRERLPRNVMTGPEFFRNAVELGSYSCSVVLGLCRRQMIEESKLTFMEGVAFEDELWTPQTLLAATRVKYIDYYFYYHVMREGSVMHTKDTDKQGRELVFIAHALADVREVPKECEKVWYDNLLGKYFSGFCIGKMYRKECRTMVSKAFPLPYIRSMKNFIRCAVYLVNYRLFCELNNRGVKINRARGVVRS